MVDSLLQWMLTLGAEPKKQYSNKQRMAFLCGYFDLPVFALSIPKTKQVLDSIRPIISRGEKLTKERFIVLSLLPFEPKGKWSPAHIAFCRSKRFYQSSRWKHLRLKALAQSNVCMACGMSPSSDGIKLHVDHVLPRSIYPEYALSLKNLQILCADCNIGKGNTVHKRFK